jgi:hypothetical protein
MSYASVASHNAPSPSQQVILFTSTSCPRHLTLLQPHPDPSLLNTKPPAADNIADDGAKVSVVSTDFKSNAAIYTSEGGLIVNDDEYNDPPSDHDDRRKKLKKRAKQGDREAEVDGEYIWEVVKRYLLQPGVAGGFIGLGQYPNLPPATVSFVLCFQPM